MTKLELAGEYMYSLYNHADHLARLVDNARHALAGGAIADAIDWLEQAAQRPAPMIDMCLRDAIRSAKEAK